LYHPPFIVGGGGSAQAFSCVDALMVRINVVVDFIVVGIDGTNASAA
jgi:hypothetical protein